MRSTNSRTRFPISARVCAGVRPSGDGRSMPATIWSFSAATRTWKNSSRLVDAIAQNLARSSSGTPGSPASCSTRSLNWSQLSSRLMNRSSLMAAGSFRRRGVAVGSTASGVALGVAEIPLDGDQLTLGVANDPLAVAPELRVVARKQHQPREHPGAELVEHLALAPVSVDLPVRRHRTVVHDASVRPRGLGLGEVGHGRRLYRPQLPPVGRSIVAITLRTCYGLPPSPRRNVPNAPLTSVGHTRTRSRGFREPNRRHERPTNYSTPNVSRRKGHHGQAHHPLPNGPRRHRPRPTRPRFGNGLDGRRQLPTAPAGHVLPERRGRCRLGSQDLQGLPGGLHLPRVRTRGAHRPRCLGWVQRARTPPDPEASPRRVDGLTPSLGRWANAPTCCRRTLCALLRTRRRRACRRPPSRP